MFWYLRFEFSAAKVLADLLGFTAVFSAGGRELLAMAYQAAFLLKRRGLAADAAARLAVTEVLDEIGLKPSVDVRAEAPGTHRIPDLTR